ncbi:PBP1A family penicillin-binding protein [Sporosarcina sp. G11-34]|uniref:PBP1A family penicillin-binding protein n=1 Tax=Sporosarcina sp. G11-34 TaxID=2849605 RepID=UPI0022A9D2E2|nr:PBP1A family penicillin-binding protein [Sporosarcina sp. G11-34]MCZ2258374.1 PBP1A family penicillin-binding protein [Sporosarcina sp. G11-34]
MSDQIKSRTELRKRRELEQKKNKKPKSGKGIFKKIFLMLIITGFLFLVGGAGLFAFYASSAPKLDEKLLRDPLSSELLDINQEVFLTTGIEKREFVPYSEIPDLMKEAILATEDVRFYSHHGMDFYRLGGAILANFKSGFGSQGASTLTQQVIKNSFLSSDKTLKRKAQEAWLAFQLERKYDKDEIFEMYFNKILMSKNNFGFGTAADYFYDKPLNELELHEIAMLAGLPQSPNGHSPFNNPERAEKRRNVVLGLMYQHKKITKEEMESARAIPVTDSLVPEENRLANANTKYPAFVDLVLNELEAAGLSDVLSEGVRIQTTLDPNAQSIVERAINDPDYYANDELQAGLTVLNTKTGGIVAVGGGRDYADRSWNFASRELRQLGSTMKPIIDYGPAIEYLNWSTGQTIVDEPYNYKGSKKIPVRNVDRKFKGSMTIREALYNSRNVPAVKTYEEVGPGNAVGFAAGLGLPSSNEFPSNALGGGDSYSTTQLAGAYAAFGNNGVYTEPHSITNIIYRDGKTKRNLTPKSTVAMKDSTAYMVTDMLRDVFTKGTGKKANISGLDIAGKTGTTSYSDSEGINNGVPDVWFAGYSPDYTIAVWGGYPTRKTPMTTFPKEREVPQHLFRDVMAGISAGKTKSHFKKPSSVEEVTIEYLSDPLVRANASTPEAKKRTELFVKGSAPVKIAKEEVIKVTGLNAPSGLTANYDADSQSVLLNWNHKAPDSETTSEDVQFKVLVQVDDGNPKEMTRTQDTNVVFSGAEEGKTYTFSVIAIAGELESAPASVSLFVSLLDDPIVEDDENIEDEIIDPVPDPNPVPDEDIDTDVPGDGGNNNNGNNSNSGNGNNNNENPDTPNDNTDGREEETPAPGDSDEEVTTP